MWLLEVAIIREEEEELNHSSEKYQGRKTNIYLFITAPICAFTVFLKENETFSVSFS